MLHALRSLATGRSWRSRLARGGVVLSLGVAWVAPTFGWLPPLALWNTSESVPPGLYLYGHRVDEPVVARGDYVAVRYPPHFDLPWLLKRVEGVAGDTYCWDQALGTQVLNGRAMPPPDPEAAGLGIPVWKGCVTLGPGQVVGYGRTPDSYDSRFFGVVMPENLWGVYVQVW